jgi:type IV secretion system protein TrbB
MGMTSMTGITGMTGMMNMTAMTTAPRSPRHQRLAQLTEKLQRELSPAIGQWLLDDDVIEIMANPNGELWVDRLSIGMERTGLRLPESQIEMAIGTVAAMHDLVVNASFPRMKAELPLDGSRFQGLIRPISPPTFVIRKHLKRVIALDEQVAQGTLTAWQATVLRDALRTRRNLIMVGATLSGKTVLANSLLDAMLALYGETVRLVLIEDTYELLCTAPNVLHLHTCDTVDLRTLVHDTLRLRPDRIIVGEVRGAEALELVKAWNTGHPGGITTVHADTAAAALVRLESLIEEAGVRPNPRVIATACHLLVMMERMGARQWQVREMVRCEDWDGQRYVLTSLPADGPDEDGPSGPGGARSPPPPPVPPPSPAHPRDHAS